jgi:predicted TIM-barrel fold metal-dependent hydrolase
MQPVFDIETVTAICHKGVIDADGHVLEPPDLWQRYIDPKFRDRALVIGTDKNGLEHLELDGRPSKLVRRGFLATLGRMGQTELENFTPHPDKTYVANMPYGAMDADERVRLLDAEGLDATVLYPTLELLWEAEVEDAELAQAYCRAYNRWIADFCRESGGRLIPIAHLSLGDPNAAAQELTRAVDDGCRGAFVAPFNWNHRAIADPAHDPLFRIAVEREVPLAVHPTFEPFELRSKRIENGHRLSMLSAVTGVDGVRHALASAFDFALFDRFPTLKFVLLESGGGWIGYMLDRLDGAYDATFIGNRSALKMRPSEYFRRQCFISCDPDERTIPAMADLYGADRFFWASDYPHAVHTGDYLKALESMVETMPETARVQLLGGNVRAAYGLK